MNRCKSMLQIFKLRSNWAASCDDFDFLTNIGLMQWSQRSGGKRVHLAIDAVFVVEQWKLLGAQTLDLHRCILDRLTISAPKLQLDWYCLSKIPKESLHVMHASAKACRTGFAKMVNFGSVEAAVVKPAFDQMPPCGNEGVQHRSEAAVEPDDLAKVSQGGSVKGSERHTCMSTPQAG